MDKKLFYVNNILMSLEFALNLLFQNLTSFSRSILIFFAIVHSIQKIYMQAVRSFNITFGAFIFIISWLINLFIKNRVAAGRGYCGNAPIKLKMPPI